MFTARKGVAYRKVRGGLKLCFVCLSVSIALCSLISTTSNAEARSFIVIVHPKIGVHMLERSVVSDAFLKKKTRWPNGAQIHPVDLHSQSSLREDFSRSVLKRSVAAVRNYWQQRIFSGRGVPPPEVGSEQAAVQFVATHPGGIGYVSGEAETKGVTTIRLTD